MHSSPNRRNFLRQSAVFGGSIFACSIALGRSTNAAPARIEAPVVDEVTVREITDGSHDIFLRGEERPGLTVSRTGTPEAAQGKTLESEWGPRSTSSPAKGKTPGVTCSSSDLHRTFTRTTSKS
jgi:hypothetical protein